MSAKKITELICDLKNELGKHDVSLEGLEVDNVIGFEGVFEEEVRFTDVAPFKTEICGVGVSEKGDE